MTNMSPFPSIGRFRNTVLQVQKITQYIGNDENSNAIYDCNIPLPTLTFTGTVKLHGANSAVGFHFNAINDYWCQSRENIVTPEKDNAGFACFVYSKQETIKELCYKLVIQFALSYNVIESKYKGSVVYGEWCGSKIQKGVAISELPKMFVVFGIKLLAINEDDGNTWMSINDIKEIVTGLEEHNIYNIYQFPSFSLDIDFEHPELATNNLVALTEAVEVCCPVGEFFGIKGTGEGIVWSHDSVVYNNLRFKVKGEKHQNPKVKTSAPTDIQRVNSINECVSQIVTVQRMTQGLEHLTMNHLEFIPENLGVYLKWVTNDCIKEELDTIVESGLVVKDVTSAISRKARAWFFETTQVGKF